MHVGFETVNAGVYHGFDRALQRDSVAGPPDWESVLRWRLLVPDRRHARPPIWQPEFRQRHRTATVPNTLILNVDTTYVNHPPNPNVYIYIYVYKKIYKYI